MGHYVENNLNLRETIMKKAELHPLHLIMAWVWGILFFWLLLIPTIRAIRITIMYLTTELAVTDKRVIGKAGFISSASLDLPLNKVQNVVAASGFMGKIFKYGDVEIEAGGKPMTFFGIKNPDGFKRFLMNQIDEYENMKIRMQAEEMSKAMNKDK